MKKIYITAILAFAVFSAFAQAEVAIGVKGGPNFANIDTESTAGENYNNKTGFHLGGFVLFKLTKIGIQPELLFSQQGSKLEYSGSPDVETNFSYMNIPVILKLYTVAGINLQAGPQFGFLASAKMKVDGADEEDIKNELKGSDISLALGAGWDLPFGLSIDARYNLGLSKINEGDDAPEAKNQVFQVSVGYKLFKLGK